MRESDRNQPGGHICPVSHAGWLASPLRALVQNPKKILRDLVGPGDTAMDIGCGPGFFTLPLARLVGDGGKVVAVDRQPEMLDMLRRRAGGAGLLSRIRPHACPADAIAYPGPVDFVLAFYMVHEVPDQTRFLAEIHDLLRPGGRLLVAEPRFHVKPEHFRKTLELAARVGLRAVARPRIFLSLTTVLTRPREQDRP
jgi:ubiquinone/menaquinone biosynthesis C-methylase UbiE